MDTPILKLLTHLNHADLNRHDLVRVAEPAKQAVVNAKAFGYAVYRCIGKGIMGATKYIYTNVSADVRVGCSYGAKRLKSAMITTTRALDRINPVTYAITKGPACISTPLMYTRAEVNACIDYLSHPTASAMEILQFFSERPTRIARLLQIMGVNFADLSIESLESLEVFEAAGKALPHFIEKGINPVKILDKGMFIYRGKMILGIVKVVLDGSDGSDGSDGISNYLSRILSIAGKRIVAKTVKSLSEHTSANNKDWQAMLRSEDGDDIFYDIAPCGDLF